MKAKKIVVITCMLVIAGIVLPVTGMKNVDTITREIQGIVGAESTIQIQDATIPLQVITPSETTMGMNIINQENRGDRGGDVLVFGTAAQEMNSSIASDSSGNLYIAFERPPDLYIYKSIDEGQSWNYWIAFTATSLRNPSLAVGEGNNRNFMFLAYVNNRTSIYVVRFNLSNPFDNHLALYYHNDLGVSNPRVITDCQEWAQWFAYVIFNEGTILKQDAYQLTFLRSINYGDTFVNPTMLHLYQDWPFYDAHAAHPDIDYGSNNLYVAFDDYDFNDNERDVYVISSLDYGVTWGSAVKVADSDLKDEYDPSIAAVKDLTTGKTVLVTYTRKYTSTDNDILYAYSQDGGITWNKYHSLDSSFDNSTLSDVVTSNYQGVFHAIYWKNFNIFYSSTSYLTPTAWANPNIINEGNSVTSLSPSIGVNPTQSSDEEAVIAWTDFRNGGNGNDIYFDSLINTPPNTPAAPTGPTTRVTGQAGKYFASTIDPDFDQVQYLFDWNASGTHQYSAWTSLINSGETVNKSHTWNSPGTYVVKVQAKDEHGLTSAWSSGRTVTVTVNHAPNKPKKPTGPATRLIGEAGTYWANGTDPDGDKIQYRFDWNASGSHSYSGWTSLVNSGTKLSKNHTWTAAGTYVVKVQSKDEHGVTSVWSNGLNVTVANHAPNKPKKPTGPATRLVGQAGTYWANGTDPDGDQIQYRFDWNASGSHSYSGWTSLVNSGTKLSKVHTWWAPGTYVVKVQSRDEHGALSIWSNGLTVVVSA
jgi:hypothetical protein